MNAAQSPVKVAFVHNFASHYTQGTFELLARQCDVRYYFFSNGSEWYWPEAHGVRTGRFRSQYLSGFRALGTRIVPGLPLRLLAGDHDVVIKCINGRFALPASFLSARLRGKPFILWTGIWTRIQTPAHRLFFPLTRAIYRHAAAIVVYGSHVQRYLAGEGVAPEKIFIAPHAVDNSRYNQPVPQRLQADLRERLEIPADARIILYLGRLEAIKGLPYLIEAVAALDRTDTVLVLAGSGSERASLEALVRERKLEARVRFTGYVPPDRSVIHYALADVFVLPSISLPAGRELWGLVVNEAFNQGVPVIASEAVGAAAGGLVRDGVNGFVVPERDSAALAGALQKILDDGGLRERFSRNARDIISGWTQQAMAERFQDAIAYALAGRRP